MRGKHSEFATGHIADEELERVGRLIGAVREIYHGRVVGQETLYSALVTSLIAQGHVLLESVPGLAKKSMSLYGLLLLKENQKSI